MSIDLEALIAELAKILEGYKQKGKRTIPKKDKEFIEKAVNLIKEIKKGEKTKGVVTKGEMPQNLVKVGKPTKTREFKGRTPQARDNPKEKKRPKKQRAPRDKYEDYDDDDEEEEDRRPRPRPRPRPGKNKKPDYTRDAGYEDYRQDALLRRVFDPVPYDFNQTVWSGAYGNPFPQREPRGRIVPVPPVERTYQTQGATGPPGPAPTVSVPPKPRETNAATRISEMIAGDFHTELGRGCAREIVSLWLDAKKKGKKDWINESTLADFINALVEADTLYAIREASDMVELMTIPLFRGKPTLAYKTVDRRIKAIGKAVSIYGYEAMTEPPPPPPPPPATTDSSPGNPVPVPVPHDTDSDDDDAATEASGSGRYKRGGDILPELRDERPPAVRQLINNYGDWQIDKIVISKKPIPQTLEKLANIITVGYFEKIKKRSAIEKYMHLYSVLSISQPDGRGQATVLIEKNELVGVKYQDRVIPGEQDMIVGHVPRGLTVEEYISNGEEFAWQHNLPFYIYDAVDANCQKFQEWLLKGNNLWSHTLSNFILQDVDVAIAPWLKGLLRGVTDLKAKLNIVFHGRGKDFGGLIIGPKFHQVSMGPRQPQGGNWLNTYSAFKQYI